MWDWFYDLFEAAGVFVRDLIFDLVFRLFRLATQTAFGLVSAMGLPEPPERFLNAVGSLPADMVNIFIILGGPEAVGIIITALTTRFFLGLIPFIRAGR